MLQSIVLELAVLGKLVEVIKMFTEIEVQSPVMMILFMIIVIAIIAYWLELRAIEKDEENASENSDSQKGNDLHDRAREKT